MKELIKPNEMEEHYQEVQQYQECGTFCNTGDTCNRHCDQGSTNKAPSGEDDLLF